LKTLPTAIKELEAFVAQSLQERDLVGLSVAVASDTGVIRHRGFGYADKQRALPATADTWFDAASISKVRTATAVMQLAERGRIDIDAPLIRHLPNFAIKSRFESSSSDITVRQLLNHHSGLPAELAKGLLAPHPEPGAHTRRCTQLARDLKTAHLSYPPNYTMSYSNLGFSLLGCLVAEVSGQSFPDYMQQHVLRKAGMTASTFDWSPGVEDRVAKPYVRGEEAGRLHARDLPAGALITTARDMGLFLKAYLDESTDTLLSRPSRQSMVTRQNATVRTGPQLRDRPRLVPRRQRIRELRDLRVPRRWQARRQLPAADLARGEGRCRPSVEHGLGAAGALRERARGVARHVRILEGIHSEGA